MSAMERKDIDEFAAKVLSRIGMECDEHNIDLVGQVLQGRVQASNCADLEQYLGKFRDQKWSRSELTSLAVVLTVPETYFFRHPEHFRVLKQLVLPQIIRQKENEGKISILSAGCASGEEAYSIAASVGDMPELASGCHVSIVGIDIHPGLLTKAVAARYQAWSLRSMPNPDRERYFKKNADNFVLRDDLRSKVEFRELNLLEDAPGFWRPERFDVVFFRNVLIYFTPESARIMVDRINHSLAPRGYLFLGPSETLRGLSNGFDLRHTHEAFYYQKRPDSKEERKSSGLQLPWGKGPIPEKSTPLETTEPDWISNIADSAGRIEAIARKHRSYKNDPGRAEAGVTPIPAGDLGEAKELFQQERYQDALKSLLSLNPAPEDSDSLLLQAILLANTGQLLMAEEICQKLLTRDQFRHGAHYLLAVCRERTGDLLAAAEHDQTAIYLDPTFSMPRLHLGLLVKRLGDLQRAKQELSAAADLLLRDDASRIVLFGGGFSREALIRFCRIQLELITR